MKSVPYYGGLAVIAVGVAMLALPEKYGWERGGAIVLIVTGSVLVAKSRGSKL